MAIADGSFAKDLEPRKREGDVILGDDWVAPNTTAPGEITGRRARRNLFALRSSPLARKIITFNLIALAVLVAGILYSNSTENSLAAQRSLAIVNQAKLVADVVEVRLEQGVASRISRSNSAAIQRTLDTLDLAGASEVFVFDAEGALVARRSWSIGTGADDPVARGGTYLTDGLRRLWKFIASPLMRDSGTVAPLEDRLQERAKRATQSDWQFNARLKSDDGNVFTAGTPIVLRGNGVGVLILTSAAGEIDRLARAEQERVLRMFLVAILVSVGLSLVLASTIANPIADLSEAAELGRDKNSNKVNPGQVRIPDLTARPDEIGRLSGALRSMVAALYTRIEGNEQFAADVAHEIKNPLASLRSAVGTLRMVKREDQRDKLLDVIDHDVRRLDRLVSDISNASRLDAELVKEEEETFNLLKMVENLGQYLGEDARSKGIDFILDLPSHPIDVTGLEARLAQVFVNLITNAVSFCEEGDAIRVWARKRENRVIVVVEDTGPGIPDQALAKVFKRFYSQRPEEHFGNNSGLGLAISKQIVEAHGGVIWAENIRPTDVDITSEPLGARFVVGLPI
ncbi:MAG: sensor histidine kinase [Pseudomonadota bacterium]